MSLQAYKIRRMGQKRLKGLNEEETEKKHRPNHLGKWNPVLNANIVNTSDNLVVCSTGYSRGAWEAVATTRKCCFLRIIGYVGDGWGLLAIRQWKEIKNKGQKLGCGRRGTLCVDLETPRLGTADTQKSMVPSFCSVTPGIWDFSLAVEIQIYQLCSE